MAAQDQSLSTQLYHSNIIKDGTDPKCRLCHKYNESIDHIVSGCPTLANNEYTERHNKVASYIHWNICRKYCIEVTTNWYEHTPPTVIEKDNITVLWDMPIITSNKLKANRPDIIVKDRKTKTCYLIDISIPCDNNVGIKEIEKRSNKKKIWKLKLQESGR